MNKVYTRINWENYPSEKTALNESNLNRIDAALNEVDTRVVTHETTKLDVATANTMVRNISFNERTGIFTVTYLNGSTKELDTKLEKIATNFKYDAERQKLILTLVDGSTQEIDVSELITEYEFENSAYINWTVESGKVKAEVIDGSITEDKLQPNFLADCRLYAGNAEESARLAGEYAQQAKESAENAESSLSGIEERVSSVEGAIEATKEIKIGVISPIQNIEINGASWVKKSNNVVSINFSSKATELVTGWQGMASIPKEFAPPSNMYFSGSLGGLSSVQIVLTSNGAILTSNDIAKGTGIYFAVSYIV